MLITEEECAREILAIMERERIEAPDQWTPNGPKPCSASLAPVWRG